jgi:hypothetical protein
VWLLLDRRLKSRGYERPTVHQLKSLDATSSSRTLFIFSHLAQHQSPQHQRTSHALILAKMNQRPSILHFPAHLPFPITITSLLVQPDATIKKHDGLLVYKFNSFLAEEQGESDELVRKDMVEQFDSPWEGVVTEWHVKEGTIITSSRFVLLLF